LLFFSTFIILLNVTRNVEKALSNSYRKTKHTTRSQAFYLLIASAS